MGTLSGSYTYTFEIDAKMFRKALYFNTFAKQRFQAVIVAAMWVLGLGLLVANLVFRAQMSSVMQLCYIVLLIALPLLAFSCESGYRRYRDSPSCGKPRTVSLSDDWLKFKVSGGEGSEKIEWRLVSAVFELEDFFIIYRDANLMVLLPKAAVPAEDLPGLRSLFRRHLGRGFHLRSAGEPALAR